MLPAVNRPSNTGGSPLPLKASGRASPSPVPCFTDIIEAIELIRSEIAGVTLDAFEPDRRKRWLVERGIKIVSEAGRRLSDALKARHPGIPWLKVAGIGNMLRHDY